VTATGQIQWTVLGRSRARAIGGREGLANARTGDRAPGAPL